MVRGRAERGTGARVAAALMAVVGFHGCGLENELIGLATDRGHVVTPAPRPTVLHGRSTGAAGGEATFVTGAGQAIDGAVAVIAEDGRFTQTFSGAEGHRGLGLWATRGDRSLAGLLPELPRQPSVYHDVQHVFAWDAHSALGDLNAASTALTLVVVEAARRQGVSLSGLEPGVLREGLDAAADELARLGSPVQVFAQVLDRVDAASVASAVGEPALRLAGWKGPGSWLSAQWLDAAGVDYTGDGVADLDTQPFDAALAAAAAEIELGVCYPDDTIRVVFQVDLRSGVKNRNCSEVDAHKWASEGTQKAVFFTGGVHTDAPICGAGRTDHCLTEAQVDAINGVLGNWVPNQVAMFDDGTGGDAKAGDDVWTVAFDLPYIPTATSPDGAGVRLAYKYTYGLPGQGWTDTEEWPGNQRLLELEDLNGDHLVVRYDLFGDEAANKDKVNALKLSKGGCGTIAWEAVRDPACAGDSRENRVDTDGDCEPDAWAAPGPVTPLSVPCNP